MPIVFIVFGLTFKFYSNDHEPIHIHVIKGEARAKFTINPVKLVKNYGLKTSEIRLAKSIIEENKEVFAGHWNSFFNKGKL